MSSRFNHSWFFRLLSLFFGGGGEILRLNGYFEILYTIFNSSSICFYQNRSKQHTYNWLKYMICNNCFIIQVLT